MQRKSPPCNADHDDPFNILHTTSITVYTMLPNFTSTQELDSTGYHQSVINKLKTPNEISSYKEKEKKMDAIKWQSLEQTADCDKVQFLLRDACQICVLSIMLLKLLHCILLQNRIHVNLNTTSGRKEKKQKQEFLIFLYALQQQKIIVAYNFEIASVSINGRNKYYEVVVHLKMLKCCTENAFRGIRCSTPYPSAFIFF